MSYFFCIYVHKKIALGQFLVDRFAKVLFLGDLISEIFEMYQNMDS